jgi:hypothetical protein
MAGTGNSLTKTGNRFLTYNLPNTRNYGSLVVSAGGVAFGGGTAGTTYYLTNTGPGSISLGSNTFFGFYTSGGGTVADSITLTGNSTIFFGAAATNTNGQRTSGTVNTNGNTLSLYAYSVVSDGGVSGVISGSGNVVVTGGAVKLLAANIFTGTASATAGTLTVSNTNALQDATYLPGAGGTVSFTGNPVIGGLTGSGALTPSVTFTFGGVNATKNDTFSGTLNPTTIQVLAMNSGTGLSVQTWSSISSLRNNAATNITRGAFQITTTQGLYGASPSGTTTVSSGGGLWIANNITPNFAGITITGTGAAGSTDGAIRNVSGNNMLTSTVTLGGSATIQSDSGTLTLSTLTLGTANTLTLKTTGTGGITLGAAATGTSTSAISIPVTSTVKAGTTSVLAATTNTITGTFDTNTFAQTIASGKTLRVDGEFAGGATLTTIAGVLDGTGSITGAGGVSVSTGGALNAGNATTNNILSIVSPLTFAAGTQSMTLTGGTGTGTVLSKVAVTGGNAVTHTGTVTVNAISVNGWTANSTHTFLTYGSRSGAGTFAKGTLSGGNARQDIGNIVTDANAATFDIVNGNINNIWNGGVTGTGAWFDGQPTGWTGTNSLTDFVNGDSVTFNASNTTTAVLTGDVTVGSLTMNGAAHTIGDSFTLTNTGTLTVSGAFTQTLNTPGDFQGNISVAAGSTLAFGNPNALGTSTGTLTLTGASPATLQWNSILGFSTNKSITLSAAASTRQFLKTVGNAVATLAGAITGGGALAFLTKTGPGVVALTNTGNTFNSILQIGYNSAESPGTNVLRAVPSAISSATQIRLNAGSILEIDNGSSPYTFSRSYGTAGFYTEDLVADAGGGFSSRGTGGITVSSNITFGVPTNNWKGPLYVGTAAQIGTSQGDVTFSGTIDLGNTTVNQTIYAFSGSRAVFTNLFNSSVSTSIRAILTGSGIIRVSSSSSNSIGVDVVNNVTLELTDTTVNIFPSLAINNATVSKPSDIGALSYTGDINFFEANGVLSANGPGIFTPSNVTCNNVVTFSGNGSGFISAFAGGANAASGVLKKGTGTWTFTNLFFNGSAGAEVQDGLLIASRKNCLGNGPLVLKGGKIQFTDTSTQFVSSVASLSTVGQTSTPRIILGG